MTPEREVLRRNFLPENLKPLLVRAGVAQTVAVQAHPSVAESRWLLELASANDFIAGVVGWVDLTSRDLGKELDELQRHPKFKGVRHPIEAEPDDAWMIRQDVLEGLAELERRDIPCDLVIYPRHLKYVVKVRERCPRLRLVVDHLGLPIAQKSMDGWGQEIEVVARLPNLWCKLSGMITRTGTGWKAEDLTPYVQHVVGHFGYARVMFGTDWPICILAGSYEEVIEALRQALGPLTDEEAARVWHENAREFYRLD